MFTQLESIRHVLDTAGMHSADCDRLHSRIHDRREWDMRTGTLVIAVGLAIGGLGHGAARATTLHALFQAQAGYSEAEIRAMTDAFTKLHPDITVSLEFVPYEALHDKTVLARGSSHAYDVVLSDSVWTPEYATNRIVADVTARMTPELRDNILTGALGSAAYQGKFYGLPWIVDSKFLFYNKAMFAKAGIATPPHSWAEVEQDAITLKQKGVVEYPLVSSWSQNEALTADYAAILQGFDGSFVDAAGRPTFQTGGGLAAAQWMAQSILVDKVTNPHSLEYVEDDVKRVFSSGQAAMALNWTYMWDGANTPSNDTKIAGQVGVVAAPGLKPGEVGATNGSQPLCIPSNSKNQDAAWTYIVYLTSAPVQNAYATNSLPMWKGSFDDPKVIAGRTELLAAAKASFAVMTNRPMVVNYQQFSTTLQQSLQQVATGRAKPDAALQQAAQALGASD